MARVFLVAAEASGDALGADLIDALHALDPALEFAGVGGAAMAARGVVSAIDIGELAVLGLVDGLKAYPRVVARADETVAAVQAFDPDAVVLIDSWGFTLRVAQRLRRSASRARLIKYVGPQVWATRPGRARTLAQVVDHLVCIHDFEPPYYAPFGLDCTVCGHPALGRETRGNGEAFRTRHGLGDRPVALVLPGSRRSEVRRTAPILFDAAGQLLTQIAQLQVVVVGAPAVASEVRALSAAQPFKAVLSETESEKEDAFSAATAALAVSGTVTTEVALQGTPVVVGYRLGWVTWALARAFLYKSKFATLMNVAARREVAPEFIQTRCTAANLASAAAPLLADPSSREAQVAAQDAALKAMGRGGKPAAQIAAGAVMDQIARQPRLVSGT